MAKVNLSLPRNLLEGGLNDSQRIARIESYLYQLNEQLRYELTHIDEDNMGGDGLSAEALSPQAIRKIIDQEINTAEIDISGNSTVVEIMEAQRRADSQYNSLNALVQSHSTNIKDLRTELGKKAASSTVDALSNRVGTNENNIQALTRDKAAKSVVDALSNRLSTDEATINTLSSNVTTLQGNYNQHYHGISASESGGVITITQGAVQYTPGSANFNIADTAYYKNAVSAAERTGWTNAYNTVRINNNKTGAGNTTINLAAGGSVEVYAQAKENANASVYRTVGTVTVKAADYAIDEGLFTQNGTYYAYQESLNGWWKVTVNTPTIVQSWVQSFTDVTVTAKSGGRYNVSGKVTIRLKLSDDSTQDLGPYTVSKVDV